MPRCQTKYLGEVVYGDDAVIEFPAGIPGFEPERRFLLLAAPDLKPIVFMQSLMTPELCFTTLPVLSVIADYKLSISDEDLHLLGLAPGSQPLIGKEVACLAVIHFSEQAATANLLAPLVIHLKSRRGAQAIAPGGRYSHQHELHFGEVAAC